MEARNNQTNIGSGDGFLNWAIVVATILLFFKTADVFSYFAPQMLNDIFQMDVSYLYGIVTALLVEGLILALHFNSRAHNHPPAVWVKWIALSISGLCQIFDGFITQGTISQMSGTLKAVLVYGVPLIPLLMVVMLLVIGRLPEDKGASLMERIRSKGLKHTFDGIKELWHGQNGGLTVEQTALAKDVEQTALKPKKSKGAK